MSIEIKRVGLKNRQSDILGVVGEVVWWRSAVCVEERSAHHAVQALGEQQDALALEPHDATLDGPRQRIDDLLLGRGVIERILQKQLATDEQPRLQAQLPHAPRQVATLAVFPVASWNVT